VVDLENVSPVDGWPAMGAASETVARIVLSGVDSLTKVGSRPVVAVVGSEGYFGKEIVSCFASLGLEVLPVDICDDLHTIRNANIVVSAVGKPSLIRGEHLTPSAFLLVDLGFRYDEAKGTFSGDFDESAHRVARHFTPVPGGIGPLNVLTLLERAVEQSGGMPIQRWRVIIN